MFVCRIFASIAGVEALLQGLKLHLLLFGFDGFVFLFYAFATTSTWHVEFNSY